jgi:hypothetical protein
MVESIMYFGIGFLFAALIGVAITPLIHGRAVQLTIRRLEASIPQSRAEIQADKDLLRAEFALSTRRLEMSVEQLMNKTTNQLSELGKKGDAINRLKIERDAQNVELIALKTRIEALNERLTAAGNEARLKAMSFHLCRRNPRHLNKKLGLAGQRAVRTLDAIHLFSASGWLGKDLTFLPGYRLWSLRPSCLLTHPTSRTISSRATGHQLYAHPAVLLAFSLRL